MKRSCPDIVALEQFVLGDLGAPDRSQIESHVQTCADCRQQVNELDENLRIASSLRRAADDGPPAFEFSTADPTQIGPYRILRKLGQGGMGAVYEAEQENPRRVVALKMIRPGLVSRSLLARFRHEAQVLGRLRHPGIAQIYEAGTHQSPQSGSQPYFVMEAVRGRPLLAYAQENQLGTRQRLDLLSKICDAVQHAHERGVIHRDLKPDNILVEESADGTAQPKILDFGVARVIDPEAQTTTLHTSAGQIVGTVAYMSPEQASGQAEHIDTRSDVYALGVIAYQLLCGRLPYALSTASVAESVRTIVQDDPTPLGSIDRSLRGDVTTIVGKALSKEKARRYPSAAEMAADVRRHLRDEPITAHPPSTLYQLGKFARRNKGLVVGVALAFVVLILGIVGTSLGLVQARRERDAARTARSAADASAAEARTEVAKQEAVNSFLQEMLAAANPRRASVATRARGRDVTVLEALNEAAAKVEAGGLKDQPHIETAVRLTMGVTYSELGQLEPADVHTQAALKLAKQHFGEPSKDVADCLNTLAFIRRSQGRLPEAEALSRDALAMTRQVYGGDHRNVAVCISGYAQILEDLGRIKEAEPLLRETLEMRRRLFGDEHLDVAASLNNLALMLDQQGRIDEAEAMYRQALAIRRKLLGDAHPDNASVLNNLGFILRSRRQFDEAEAMFRASLAMRRKFYGDEHPSVALTVNNLGSLLQAVGRLDEAGPLYLEAIATQRKVLGDAHPALASSVNNLATLYRDQGRFAESEPLFRESLAIRRKALGDKHPAVAVGMANLSSTLRELGRLDEAESLAREAVQISLAARGPESPDLAAQRSHLALCLLARKRYADAETELLEAWRVLSPRFASRDVRAVSTARSLRKLYLDWDQPDRAAEFDALLATTQPSSRPTTRAATGDGGSPAPRPPTPADRSARGRSTAGAPKAGCG